MKNILDKISYKPGYEFQISQVQTTFEPYRATLLRVATVAECSQTGKHELQVGRWFVVEDPSNEQEVVRTAYQAIYLFEIHELQEHFKYDGKVVFDPHKMNI